MQCAIIKGVLLFKRKKKLAKSVLTDVVDLYSGATPLSHCKPETNNSPEPAYRDHTV